MKGIPRRDGRLLVILTVLAFIGIAEAANTGFVLFDQRFDRKDITTQDATVAETGTASRALRVITGTRQQWPGITLRAPGQWDLSGHAHVAVTLRNAGTNDVRISCRVDNPGADGTKNCVTDSLALAPGGAVCSKSR